MRDGFVACLNGDGGVLDRRSNPCGGTGASCWKRHDGLEISAYVDGAEGPVVEKRLGGTENRGARTVVMLTSRSASGPRPGTMTAGRPAYG
jgi:hypothetical protein